MADVIGKLRIGSAGHKWQVVGGKTLVTVDDPGQKCCCPEPPDPCAGCGPEGENWQGDLVTNGSFESGMTGWTSDTTPGPVVINQLAGGYTLAGHPDEFGTGPDADGFYNFIVGSTSGSPGDTKGDFFRCHQDIDVSGYSDAIDAGAACFALSAYLGVYSDGGFTAQADCISIDVMVGATVLCSIGKCGRAKEEPPGPSGTAAGWYFQSCAGTLPAGARTVRIRITMTRDPEAHPHYATDGWADYVKFGLCAAANG